MLLYQKFNPYGPLPYCPSIPLITHCMTVGLIHLVDQYLWFCPQNWDLTWFDLIFGIKSQIFWPRILCWKACFITTAKTPWIGGHGCLELAGMDALNWRAWTPQIWLVWVPLIGWHGCPELVGMDAPNRWAWVPQISGHGRPESAGMDAPNGQAWVPRISGHGCPKLAGVGTLNGRVWTPRMGRHGHPKLAGMGTQNWQAWVPQIGMHGHPKLSDDGSVINDHVPLQRALR